QVSINFNLHRFRLILQDTLGSQYLFYLRCTNAKGNGSKCTVRGGMAIAAYNGLARNGNPQFGTNDMNNALIRMAEPIQFYSKIRSEEHTSELQSRFDLVCRLLLEKKK